MKRSPGVTVSAILVFIGSGLTIMLGGLMAFAVLLVPKAPQQPPFIRYILAFSIVLYMAFGIWGIVSGIGLLRLRQWARISMLVFSGILLFFTIPGLLIVPFMPMPEPPDSPGHIVLAIKIFMGCFYGAMAAIGGGWIYFFNRRSVKEQFRGRPEPGVVFAPQMEPVGLAQAEPTLPVAKPSKRPLSISIIGWILIATSWMALPVVFLRSPMLFMGYLLANWRASLFMLTWCVAQVAAGVGLLRLRPWGRTLAIFLFAFGMVNAVANILVPGATARLVLASTEMQARMGLPTTGPGVVGPELLNFFIWAGAIFGVGFMAVQMWFVVTRKQAFAATAETPTLLP